MYSSSITRLRYILCCFGILFPAILFSQQLPFHGSPAAIPGIIEAEDFDTGGENVAYHDTDQSNNGGQYRSDSAVDIERTTDGGFNIGWTQPGEWLEFTVFVQRGGSYRFEFRIASASSGGDFYLEFDGKNATGTVHFPATNGWQNWETVTIAEIVLAPGEQVMRFVCESDGFNLDYINIVHANKNPPTVEFTAPQDGASFAFGEDIQLAATALDSNGSIEKVEFYANDKIIGADITEPYTWQWASPATGKYDLVAIAVDNEGSIGVSKKVDITVLFPAFSGALNLSHERGFYTQAFNLNIAADFENATVNYTLDGSDPLFSATAKSAPAPLQIWIDPENSVGRGDTPGVVFRAVGMKNNLQHTAVITHSYLFVEKVKTQGHPGGEWPDSGINGQYLRYEVSSEVANDNRYADLIDDALLDIPSISLVTDLKHLFDSDSGIYVNAVYHGRDWERPVSVELLNPDKSDGFHIDAGMRIRGGWSRHDEYPKHAFRLFFRVEYGEEELVYPLFENEGVDRFRKMDLRASQNYAWSNGNIYENVMNRDVFSRDLQREMGQPYTRSRYYHLYVNGLYWGLFQTQERSEANFAESYFGGKSSEYDVVKVDIGDNFNLYDIEATDGNLDAWREVWDALNSGFVTYPDYFRIQGLKPDGTRDPSGRKLIDIDNLIDYMLTIFYGGNFDAPVSKFSGERNPNNFYAIFNREANDGFIFLNHDAEHTLLVDRISPGAGIDEDRVNIELRSTTFNKFHPQYLHAKLTENSEYRQRFADRIYCHMFNDGAMTAENVAKLFLHRANEIDLAIIAESARWGDLLRSKNNAWQPAIDLIVNDYFPRRGEIVMQQFQEAGLYPVLQPPIFQNNSREIQNSELTLDIGLTLELLNPNSGAGSIFYTLDGSDPRMVGGAVSPSAIDLGDGNRISVRSTAKLLARIHDSGNWSALHELKIYGSENLGSLLLSEIHYHPLDEGATSGKLFEFIELQNTGTSVLNLSLISFIRGIDYTFPSGTILPEGKFLVLASDKLHFQQRYGFAPFAEFTGQLDNAGENLTLATATIDTLITLRYNDKSPWPESADGAGYSLTWTNNSGNGEPGDPRNWTASHAIHGSPGEADLAVSVSANTAMPQRFALYQNYPNPFNPTTTIQFYLAKSSFVKLNIYDILGRHIETVFEKHLPAGQHEMIWQANSHAAGVYFYRIEAGSWIQTRKALLLK
ncbi:MAG: T9SS C-terminal target domain-containing protein [Calditrichaeota bacterium]|nr:MAG: T9SS C-terminal target domain-containing protein [Calditrichota bacterium]